MKLIYSLILGFVLTAMFAACSDSGKDDPSGLEGNLVLKVDKSSLPASEFEQVNFTVMAGDKDVTSYCKIWNMTSKAEVLPGRIFSTTEPGEYKFIAKYEGESSNEVKVTFIPVKYFVKNLLLQQITSTECVNCPAMTNNINFLLNEFPEGRIKWLAFHGRMRYTDPFQISDTYSLLEKWGAFYPNLILDASESFGENGQTPEAAERMFKKYLNLSGQVGIAIDSRVIGNEITVKVSVKSLRDFPEGCKLGVYLSENYLSAKQTVPGSSAPVDYTHDRVVRKCLTYVFGDILDDDVVAYNKDYEQTFNYTMVSKDEWNVNNMEVTVCVIEGAKDKVINSQSVKLGEKIDFEYAGNE